MGNAVAMMWLSMLIPNPFEVAGSHISVPMHQCLDGKQSAILFCVFGCSMSFSQKESAMTLLIIVLYHKDNVSLDENQPVANDVIE